MAVYPTWKNEGETPLERIRRLRVERPELQEKKLTYLGRLDPMAEGVLLIGEGIDSATRASYLALPKTYMVEVLFGIATDTYDILGLVTDHAAVDASQAVKDGITKKISMLPGTFEQPYPAFSSKPTKGSDGRKLPLFQFARAGVFPAALPVKRVAIHYAQVCGMQTKHSELLAHEVAERISKVRGDFRQTEIQRKWTETLAHHRDTRFPMVSIELSVSSGTYVRSIAHSLGEAVGLPALAYRICRTKVGDQGGIDESSIVSYKVPRNEY